MLKKIAIIGSGSFATALVKLFTEGGITVSWLVRTKEQETYIRTKGRNPRYLSSLSLIPHLVEPTTIPSEVVADADFVLFVVPSSYLKSTLGQFDTELLENKQLGVAIKGFVPGENCTPSRYLQMKVPGNPTVLVLAGPCHAEEIANRKSTYVTICGEKNAFINKIADSLKSDYIHTVTSTDPMGMELVATLKNIVAIATGIASGLQYGDNFQAVLVSNAMREIDQFLQTTDTRKRDLFHSGYFGDLLVTAYSEYSRNRTLGKLVGRGIHVSKAIQAMEMVAEGFNASREFYSISKKNGKAKMPVITAVHRILHKHANPFHEFKLLEKQLS